MNADQLRAVQTPFKDKYRQDPESAVCVMRASATLHSDDIACDVTTRGGPVVAGLHPAAGGDGQSACSGDMLLESLVACAGVTLRAVATALSIPLRSGTITAEGDLDFRGTLGVVRDVPIGLQRIRLGFQFDSDATDEQLEKLLSLTERYCVILQTLKHPPEFSFTRN